MRRRREPGGFTLLELLCVVALLLVLLRLGSSALEGWERGSGSRMAAQSFVQALSEARELARRRGCRTRVVFSLAGARQADLPEEEQPPLNAFALFVFQEPADPAQIGSLQAPTRAVESTSGSDTPLLEWVALSSAALPEGLVGQWVRCPERLRWTRLEDGVTVEGELLDEWTQKGFTAFQAQHYYQPEATWDAKATVTAHGKSNLARFPASYPRTPFPFDYPLVSAPLPASETVWDYAREREVPARELWGSQPLRQFVGLANPQTHSFELPGLEFAPDGSLATRQLTPVKVRFHPLHRAQPAYEVATVPATGRAALLQP